MDEVKAGRVVWAMIIWHTQKKVFSRVQIFASEEDARRLK